MNPLEYLLLQPACALSTAQRDECDSLLAATAPGAWIDYTLSAPKWLFLSYLCQSRNLVLHGSQNIELETIEPRKALDIRAFSTQEAIYATTDGIWSIYFAIVDRKNFKVSLFNSCLDVRLSPEQVLGPLYFFSITHSALVQNPWCRGAIYILPRQRFEQEPPQQMMGAEIIFPHWVSSHPTRPIAKLRVEPHDFPFLDQVHGHDDEKINRLATEDPNGFPWPTALIT